MKLTPKIGFDLITGKIQWELWVQYNTLIFYRFNEMLRVPKYGFHGIVAASYHVSNEDVHCNTLLASVEKIIFQISVKYSERLTIHTNALTNQLNVKSEGWNVINRLTDRKKPVKWIHINIVQTKVNWLKEITYSSDSLQVLIIAIKYTYFTHIQIVVLITV